mgnify:CR=1 FL=1
MASGIRDKVAILGMGCTRFGEHWDKGAEELMVGAFEEAIGDAGIERKQIDAAWLGVGFDAMNIGPSGLPLSIALRLPFWPCVAYMAVGKLARYITMTGALVWAF